MELLPTPRFQESITTRLRGWSQSLSELQRQLSLCPPEERGEILARMQKLGSKRRAAVLTLRELSARRQRLPERGEPAGRVARSPKRGDRSGA